MKQVITLTILLTVCSCSNLNQVRTDGGRSLNGKVGDILYVETDKGVEIIKNKLRQEFGEPTTMKDNFLTWDLIQNNQISSEPLTMTIHLDSIFHYEGQRKTFDYVNFDICLTDQNGNDLLTNNDTKDKGQELFQKIVNEMR
jgi:hypothetical protein